MPLFDLSSKSLVAVPPTTFSAQQLHERKDLQKAIKAQIGAIAPNAFVLAEEYSQWTDAKRRIDLLCLDKEANLLVIELKRTEDGGHMDLQAIRYAAMVSKLTFNQAVEAHSEYLGSEGSAEAAKAAILTFLNWDDPDEREFGKEVKIILVSHEFSKEVTTAVLWLSEYEIDIRCVRMQPYKIGDRTILDIQQVLPLAEAEQYQVQLRKKVSEERQSSSEKDQTRYDLKIGDQQWTNLPKRKLIFLVFQAMLTNGVTPGQILEIFANRKLLRVPGSCDSVAEFRRRAAQLKGPYGASHDLDRFYVEDGNLIKVDGDTWAISNQWSVKHIPLLRELIKRHSNLKIAFTESHE